MRVLLDTHTLIWAVDDVSKLSPKATAELINPANELLVSAVSAWEIAIKVSIGKMTLSLPFRDWITKAVADLPATLLGITIDHSNEIISLPQHHGDPFDRLLVAQAIVESLPVISIDPKLDAYAIRRIW